MTRIKTETVYECQQCQYQSPRWIGRCPECGRWNSFVETTLPVSPKSAGQFKSVTQSQVYTLKSIPQKDLERLLIGIGEFDHVLGGGIVPGSVTLIAGEPGIGKSTLLLEVAAKICQNPKLSVLYVSGEESARQIKIRAERMQINGERILILAENNVEQIISEIEKLKPSLVIIDSIQTLYTQELNGVSGSVGQVRESAAKILRVVKSSHTPLFLIGHVTKEGVVAGPKVLEHIVDVVLYLEGDLFHTYRILRSTKNRFGSTSEVGIFEMEQKGLKEVVNPSQFFLNDQREKTPGSVVVATLEGERPILVEIQALVTKSSLAIPRRTAVGIDFNRLVLLCAVISSRTGVNLNTYDIYVNVAGGLKVREPAMDLGISLAIASSFKNQAADYKMAVFGEVGLLGEVRKVSREEQRIKEAQKLGFHKFISAETARNLNQALKEAFG